MSEEVEQKIIAAINTDHSAEIVAERVFLGGFCVGGIAQKLLYELEMEDFRDLQHQLIFETMRHLAQSNNTLTIPLICAELVSSGKMIETVALPLLYDLADKANANDLDEKQAQKLLQNILEFSGKRQTRSVLQHRLKEAHIHSSTSTQELLEQTAKDLLDIKNKQSKVEGPHSIKVIYDEVEQFFNENSTNKGISGVPTGFKRLDYLTSGWQKKDFIVLGALPSIGKTALSLSFALEALQHFDKKEVKKPVLFFSVEMSNVKLIQRLIALYSRVKSVRIQRPHLLNYEELNKVTEALEQIKKYNFYLDETAGLTTHMIQAKTERINSVEGSIGMILVDYIGIMTAPQVKQNKVQEVSEISRTLKQLAKDYDCPVLALTQLRRGLEKEGEWPKLSDIKESGSIEQDADQVLFIHRDRDDSEKNNKAEYSTDATASTKDKKVPLLLLRKNRNGETGNIKVQFQKEIMRYYELEPPITEDY